MADIPFDADEIAAAIIVDTLLDTRKAAQAAAETAILTTPVGNPAIWARPAPEGYIPGGARGNWRVNLRGPGNPSDYNPGERDPVGSATIAKARANLALSKPGDIIAIYNATPYAEGLDAGVVSRQGSAMTLKATAAALAIGNNLVRIL